VATLSTILTHIRGNVIDVPSATENRLIGWVNEAQVVAETRYNWKGLQSSWGPVTSLGNNRLATTAEPDVTKPDDWLVSLGNPFWRGGDGLSTHEMVWASSVLQFRKDYPSTESMGPPEYLYEYDNRIMSFPASDGKNVIGDFSADGEYTVVIPYRKTATPLVGGTSTSFFTNDANLELFLENYASAQAMIFNRDRDNGALYLAKSQADMLRAKRLDKLGKVQALQFTPRRDVFASRRQRRAF
jgi:hypothetical protein